MKTYTIKWWREPNEGNSHSETVVKHGYYPQVDRFFFEYADGAVKEIAKWSECSFVLDADWRNLVRERSSPVPHTLSPKVYEERGDKAVTLVVED